MPKECWPLQEELKGDRDIAPTLLELCQELHMILTGSSDCYDKDWIDKVVHILETAVKHWVPASDKVFWKKYDKAVLNIIKIVLEEYSNSDWKELIDECNMVPRTRLE